MYTWSSIRFVWKIRELSHRVVGIATRNGIIVKKDARERRPIHTSRRSKGKFGKRLQKLTSERNYVTVHRRCVRINCRLRSKGGKATILRTLELSMLENTTNYERKYRECDK